MSRLELRRKIMHIMTGILVILLLSTGFLNISILSVIIIIGVTLSFMSIRFRIPFVSWCLRKFGRQEEKPPGKGAITYLFSILILLVFFGRKDMDIVFASIIILALGDSFACIVGRSLKKTKHLRKTQHPLSTEKLIEGTIFGMIVASLGAMNFVSILEAVIASAVAMTVEGIEFRFQKQPVDDNVTIPLAAAFTIYLIRIIV